jgi:hypothetical protein
MPGTTHFSFIPVNAGIAPAGIEVGDGPGYSSFQVIVGKPEIALYHVRRFFRDRSFEKATGSGTIISSLLQTDGKHGHIPEHVRITSDD